MKNRIADSLNRELRDVRVSPELRRRILANARSERFRKRRRGVSALAAVAAVLVVALALVGSLKILRRPAPDRKYAQGDTAAVWIDEIDRTYHSKRGCSNHSMYIASASEARARSFSACRKCIPVLNTPEPTVAVTVAISPEPTPVATEAPAEISPEPTPVATEAPAADPESIEAATELLPTVSVTIQPTSTPFPEEAAVGEMNATATSDSQDDTVYFSAEGTKFHLDPACDPGANLTTTRTEALLQGYLPCLECGADDVGYWMTGNGKWFHSAQNCKNMSGAFATSALFAIEHGKEPCKICVGQDAVWMTDGGIWYHAAEHCQNMSGAIQVARPVAEDLEKIRCPYCFVSPDDPAWMSQLSGNIYAQLEASAADGKVLLYLQASSFVTPLYGNPLTIDLPARKQVAAELDALAKNSLNPTVRDSMATAVSEGVQIGARLIRYTIQQVHVYDDSGELPIYRSRSYMPDFSDEGLLYIAETDASRTPTRVSIELGVSGCSYYLNESDEWSWTALETPYSVNLAETDVSGFYELYIAGADENASVIELQAEFIELSHRAYTPAEGCTIDAYGMPDEFSFATLTDEGSEGRSRIDLDVLESVFVDYIGYSGLSFQCMNDDSAGSFAFLLEPAVTNRTLAQLSGALGQRVGASSTYQPPLAAERSKLKSDASYVDSEIPAASSN